jgi:hypothetical protein
MTELKNGFASIHLTPFNHSAAKGLSGHINRSFRKNINTFGELSSNNFGVGDIYQKYTESYERHNKVLGRSPQKNGNTYIDAVLELSLDRYEQLEEEYSQEQLKLLIDKHIKALSADISNKLKLNSLGYQFHVDEGHIDKSSGKVIRNPHAHLIFYNYDFQNKEAPLRKLRKQHMSFIQDLCFKNFKELGFRRGISAEVTKNKHLKKDVFIAEKKKQQLLDLKDKSILIRKKLNQQKEIILANNQAITEQSDKLSILKLDINLFIKQKKNLQQSLLNLTTKISNIKENINQWLQSIFSKSNDKLAKYNAAVELNNITTDKPFLSDEVFNEITLFEQEAQLRSEEKISNKIKKGNENGKS